MQDRWRHRMLTRQQRARGLTAGCGGAPNPPMLGRTVSDDGAGGGRHLELHTETGTERASWWEASHQGAREWHEPARVQQRTVGHANSPPSVTARIATPSQASPSSLGARPTSSAANLSTAVKGASSGTEKTRKGSLGSEVRVTLKLTLLPLMLPGIHFLLRLEMHCRAGVVQQAGRSRSSNSRRRRRRRRRLRRRRQGKVIWLLGRPR